MKSVQTSSTLDLKTFDTPTTINLRPPPVDRHKSFDEEEFSKKPIVVKKTIAAPINVKSYSIADLQMATGSFSVENLLGEGSFGRVYRAQFDDGKVYFLVLTNVFISCWLRLRLQNYNLFYERGRVEGNLYSMCIH